MLLLRSIFVTLRRAPPVPARAELGGPSRATAAGKGQMEANFAVAKFDKGNKFLLDAMKHFAEKYDPACWTCVGPSLVTFLLHRCGAWGGWLGAERLEPHGRGRERRD